MFIGHYAAGFAAKRIAPRASLGMLFAAAQLPDLIWPLFLLGGWERVRIVPNAGTFAHLEFTHYPISHSLLGTIVCGALLGVVYWAKSRDGYGAVTVALLVMSHWLLDFVTHRPDLPLYPGGSARVGLGLWNSPAATVALEAAMFAGALAVYSRTTRPLDRTGSYALWSLVTVILVVYLSDIMGPPPPDTRTLALFALAGWLLPPWAAWADRHRALAAEHTAPAAARA